MKDTTMISKQQPNNIKYSPACHCIFGTFRTFGRVDQYAVNRWIAVGGFAPLDDLRVALHGLRILLFGFHFSEKENPGFG
jgi:hypothetical protein